ncbi:MAG: molybdate ABC transporter substrate-binding protein [Saprospiraceae bacterium]
MKQITAFLLSVFILLACGHEKSAKLTIAAAANVQFAMEELTEQFAKKTGVECHAIHSSSGKLTAQIKEGAPYDLFISANMKYPDELHQSGLTTDPAKPYAYGKLVLWTMMDEILSDELDIQKLADNHSVKHLAIANPKTAPYGEAAVEAFHFYNLYDALQPKLVFGESISQVNQFVLSKTAEVGITAMSVVLSPKIKDQGHWAEVPQESYTPIAQGCQKRRQ